MGAPPELVARMQDNMDIDIWPENWTAVRLFIALQTQWRIGKGGPTGLDYSALPVVFTGVGLRRREARRQFMAIQIMEGEALRVFAEKRENNGR